ncbi:MAG: ATP-binding protein [Microbacterium sp.]
MATGPAARPPLGDIGDIAGGAGGAGGNGAERFTESRVERIVALVVALGCAVLGTQAFVNALSTPQAAGLWRVGLLIVAFLPLAAMILALATGAFARGASRLCALSLVVVLAFWPLATAGAATDPSVQPWVWYLLNVATAAAVMAFEVVLQIVWAVLVPALYAAVRLTQIDAMPAGANPAQTVGIVLDAVFALILAGVIIALGWMLRGTAVGIDRARRDAVASYAAAAEADAVETERVAVAALMHDSVLAALIAAERASTPREEALAVSMAREALTRLANAEQDVGEGSDEAVPVASIVTGIERAAADLGLDLRVRSALDPDGGPVPGRVARAIVLAATQAVANAVQHAGARGLVVSVRADPATISVQVSDAGAGFAPASVPVDRLGIRGSIVARMAAAGGRARVQTGAEGTTIRLDWDRPR